MSFVVFGQVLFFGQGSESRPAAVADRLPPPDCAAGVINRCGSLEVGTRVVAGKAPFPSLATLFGPNNPVNRGFALARQPSL